MARLQGEREFLRAGEDLGLRAPRDGDGCVLVDLGAVLSGERRRDRRACSRTGSPFAARTEWGPSGRLVSKLAIGASGTVSKREYVTPFLMSVLPSRSIRMSEPRSFACSRNTTSGNAAPPWETRIAGPVSGTFRIGVTAFAVPMNDPGGQPAGFAANCASVHACWSVVRRAGRILGSVRSTLWMFASPGF